ncbi:hypothetical protein PYK79_31705 [Streptomyces sp. ID05-04B]|uniref:hypothetical protein n=1 Tax=Streptomyces sp. ID05-04B TaxID=3028661 RepID=UPI0029C21C56|nr:hypothetical protein [Streptomyces sp. ID05-04B]MDX5566899.1 hypothetical protein [Streptomyces sp. ID05-04B]
MPSTRLPSAAGCILQDAGQEWDAIRVPRQAGLAAMAILGPRCGAVVEDGGTVLYFFVPRGTASRWALENTKALGTGSSVTIPPARRTEGPGPHWRMCPGDDRLITNADALHAALADAFGPQASKEPAA